VSNLIKFLIRQYRAFADVVVEYGIQHEWPILVAIGWRLALYPSLKCNAKITGRKKLIVLAKSGGVQDVEAAYLNEVANYSVLFLPRSIIKKSGVYYLKGRVSDHSYHSNDDLLEEDKIKYRKHLSCVLKWFKRLFGVSAVVQFNVNYWAERELAVACVDQGVKFLAAHKECTWSPAWLDDRTTYYKHCVGRYRGSAISVYNEATKRIFINAGLIDSSQIVVTGCARLDVSHRFRQFNQVPNTRTVLFYLIDPGAGLNVYHNDNLGEWNRGVPQNNGSLTDWSALVGEVNNTIMNIALNNPSINFVFKGKTGLGDIQFRSLFYLNENYILPKNCEFIDGGVGQTYIREASVVIGFNTTAVLEAIAAGVPVIVPNIFSDREKEISEYAHDVNDGVLVAKTQEELGSMILDAVSTGSRYHEITQGQKDVLERMLGNSDGKSGERLRNFLDKAVLGEL